MLQRAARVHYTSEAEKLASEEMMGMNHGSVIALGVEANSATSREKLAQHFPELAREPYVLVLSRLHPKKALDVLIDAFGLLVQRPEFGSWRLVLAGEGDAEYVSMLKAKASLFAERITFTGWLEGERKNAVLNGASLLALPSHQENFGLCVMEALSHSVPVLVSANVNLAAEIASADAGWIAAIDRDALCAKLAEALSDREELARRGRAGRELSRKYSWEKTAQELAQLYQSVVAG
jgi:glycosyltransferase involved in cell wall biosynthesis